MIEHRKLFRLWDCVFTPEDRERRAKEGAQEVLAKDSDRWNEQRYGIFWCVQLYEGQRTLANYKRATAFWVDIDDGTEREQLSSLASGPAPTLILKTKRGYQAYWHLSDGDTLSPEQYVDACVNHIKPFYHSDHCIKNLVALARAPIFYHWKDPNNPHLITIEHKDWSTEYKWKDFIHKIPRHEPKEIKVTKNADQYRPKDMNNESVWSKLFSLNQAELLLKISGDSAMNGDKIEYMKPQRNGSRQIIVNGNVSSCWIDKDGYIGSYQNGGPTVFNWLKWYGLTNIAIVNCLKKYTDGDIWDERRRE